MARRAANKSKAATQEFTIEPVAERLVKALPDAITAAVFFWVWLDPTGWRTELVTQGLLIMLLEFILIHSGGFFGSIVLNPNEKRGRRVKTLLWLGAFYSLFVAAWSWQFSSWWPLLFFLWLVGAKLVDLLFSRRTPDELRQRQMGLVAASAMFYLLCVFATVFLPMPKLGLTHHGHYYGMPGSGEWVSHPYTVIGALVGYFSLLACTKFFAWDAAFARQAQQQKNRKIR